MDPDAISLHVGAEEEDAAEVPQGQVSFSHSGMSDSLQPHGLQDARLPCPSVSPRVCSNSCP